MESVISSESFNSKLRQIIHAVRQKGKAKQEQAGNLTVIKQ